jgi:hypothetical protein
MLIPIRTHFIEEAFGENMDKTVRPCIKDPGTEIIHMLSIQELRPKVLKATMPSFSHQVPNREELFKLRFYRVMNLRDMPRGDQLGDRLAILCRT